MWAEPQSVLRICIWIIGVPAYANMPLMAVRFCHAGWMILNTFCKVNAMRQHAEQNQVVADTHFIVSQLYPWNHHNPASSQITFAGATFSTNVLAILKRTCGGL